MLFTHQVTLLGSTTCEDEDGLRAAAGATLLKLVLGSAQELASSKSLDVSIVDLSLSGLWDCDGRGSGQSSEEGDSEELHVDVWWWGGRLA
jgi:hypothetical protein